MKKNVSKITISEELQQNLLKEEIIYTDLPDPRQYIIIRGAKVNNLKNINLDIPKNKLIVFTGVSGSGKSSIVFDTIYAEGQRRYVESLSSYARQFLERMNKPDVEYISGLAPSMAIDQRAGGKTSRSTVGTATEIYDYLRLLYARIGDTYSPISGRLVKRDTPDSILKEINQRSPDRVLICCSFSFESEKEFFDKVRILKEKGYYKILIKDKIYDLTEHSDKKLLKLLSGELITVIDDIKFKGDEIQEDASRIYESLETAFREGDGYLKVIYYKGKEFTVVSYSKFFEADGMKFIEPEPRLFSFNNPFGACEKCQGFGRTMDIDMDLVVPDKEKSIIDNAIAVFNTPKHSRHYSDLIKEAPEYGVDIFKPFKELTDNELQFVFEGGEMYIGLNKFFKIIEKEALYKLHYKILLNRYRAYTTCSACRGSRLRKEALYVKVGGKNIFDVVRMTIGQAYEFFSNLELDDYKRQISERLREEINTRLKYLIDVGLDYLTLDRISNTLSGGEAQRINLSTSLGSSLVGSIYVLDEPTIGLHQRDTERLVKIMKSLRDIGNTVLVVEHDRDMIKEADQIIDMGPLAGEYGGEVVFQGTYEDILKDKNSLTGKYLSGKEKIKIPPTRRKIKSSTKFITIYGARENNLKNIDVHIPINMFTCITGVSGSGKSTLVENILYAGVKKRISGFYQERVGAHSKMDGIEYFHNVEIVDQSPIGKTARSNPVTYVKAFDEIRNIFADSTEAIRRGYPSGYFSFNVPGGRCETCEGTGTIRIEMQFMADIYLICDACNGQRYKKDILDVKIKGADNKSKNIYEVLEMTVTEALLFFKKHPRVVKKLQILDDVGLGYLRLGQAANTLSGGESQRLKLAYHLLNESESYRTLFIFDEPTTGLHFYDISKLLQCFQRLIDNGNTIVVVEHNLEIIKCADYIIDLGPESGDRGGNIVAQGTPEEVAKTPGSYTGQYLKTVLQ
jgi:excinuclease ABC subunit A